MTKGKYYRWRLFNDSVVLTISKAKGFHIKAGTLTFCIHTKDGNNRALPRMTEDLVPLFTDDGGEFFPDLWWWSFDTFLISLVALAAKKFREEGHAHPGDMTEKEWNAYLKSIEDDLSSYDKFEALPRDQATAAYAQAQAAMRRVVDRLGNWWD